MEKKITVNMAFKHVRTGVTYVIKGAWDGKSPHKSCCFLMRADGRGHAYAGKVTPVDNIWDISQNELTDMCGEPDRFILVDAIDENEREKRRVVPQVLILDGPDKAGKSTLKAMLDKRFRFYHWTIDRGPLSHMVYNVAYDRDAQNIMIRNVTDVCGVAILIYVVADPETLTRRIQLAGDEMVDIHRDLMLFESILSATVHLWKGAITIDTTDATPEESLNDILNRLNKMGEVMTS